MRSPKPSVGCGGRTYVHTCTGGAFLFELRRLGASSARPGSEGEAPRTPRTPTSGPEGLQEVWRRSTGRTGSVPGGGRPRTGWGQEGGRKRGEKGREIPRLLRHYRPATPSQPLQRSPSAQKTLGFPRRRVAPALNPGENRDILSALRNGRKPGNIS